MAITYEYKIKRLRAGSVDLLSDVVVNVEFEYTGTDDKGNAYTFMGAVPMPAPVKKEFTPLQDLTEEQVIEWVKIHHPVDMMNEIIEKEIAKQVQKHSDVRLPWAPVQEEQDPDAPRKSDAHLNP